MLGLPWQWGPTPGTGLRTSCFWSWMCLRQQSLRWNSLMTKTKTPVHYTWRGSCGWTAFWKDLPRLKSGSPDPGARVLSGLHLPPHTPRWPPLLLCAPRQCSTTSDHLPSGLPCPPRPDPQGRGGQPWLISLPLGVRACVCVCGRMCVCVCWGGPRQACLCRLLASFI